MSPVETPVAPVSSTPSVSLLRAVSGGSPFGPLPDNYPHIAKLCQKGFVRCKTERVKVPKKLPNGQIEKSAEGVPLYEEIEYRDWSIVTDPGNGHTKFCMILDFLEHRAMRSMFSLKITPKVDRMNLINVALGVETRIVLSDGSMMEIDVGRLERMSWRAIKSYLASEGVKGYMVAHGKGAEHETELVADAFENGDMNKRAFL